ncbi:unnamed protein product, partial [marine sediment metagenome]
MEHDFPIDLPPETYTEAEPYREEIKVMAGVVTDVSIFFPAGCGGLVGLRILRGSMVLWPRNPDTWFVSDDNTIKFPERYLLNERPYSFTVEAYSESVDWDHTVTVSINVGG